MPKVNWGYPPCDHTPKCNIWRSNDGTSKRVCELDDNHLNNIVRKLGITNALVIRFGVDIEWNKRFGPHPTTQIPVTPRMIARNNLLGTHTGRIAPQPKPLPQLDTQQANIIAYKTAEIAFHSIQSQRANLVCKGLESPIQNFEWQKGLNEAKCDQGKLVEHLSKGTHSCGFYSFDDEFEALNYGSQGVYGADHQVTMTIQVSGIVSDLEYFNPSFVKGHLSQFVEIKAIRVAHKMSNQYARSLFKIYEVPVRDLFGNLLWDESIEAVQGIINGTD